MSDFNIKRFLTEHMDGRGSRYSPQQIAQDMHDSGMAAISEENFDELYDEYCSRYGDPDIQGNMELRAATMDAYKRLLRAGTAGGNGRIGAGAKGRGRVTEGPLDWAKEKLGMGNPSFGNDPYDNPGHANDDEIRAAGGIVARPPSDAEYEEAMDKLSSVSDSGIGSIGVNSDTGVIYIQNEDGEEYEIGSNGDIAYMGNEFPDGPGDPRGFESVQNEGDEYDDMEFGGHEDQYHEDDGFIQDNTRGGYDASVEGKFIGNFDDVDVAFQAIRDNAGPNFFPDVWFVDDHGGIERFDPYQKRDSNPYGTEGNGYDDARLNEHNGDEYDDMEFGGGDYSRDSMGDQWEAGDKVVTTWSGDTDKPGDLPFEVIGITQDDLVRVKDEFGNTSDMHPDDLMAAELGTEGNGYDDYRLDHDPDEQMEQGDMFTNALSQLKEYAGIKETAPQGAAPGAQLKGKDKLKGKGVKGYNDAHPASGQLVGEDDINEVKPGGWNNSGKNIGQGNGKKEWWDDGDTRNEPSPNRTRRSDSLGTFDNQDGDFEDLEEDPWGLGDHRKDYEHNSGSEDPRTQDIRNQTRGSEWETSGPDKYDPEHGLEDPFGLEEELLGELANFSDNKDYDSHGAAWAAKNGLDEDTAEEEEWRMAMGHDQDDPDEMIGGIEPYFDDDGEEWDSKDAYDDYHNVHEDEDDDFIGKGDADMGDDTVVGPGDLVQVDAALGGEATVVAQRAGYIVVNLPKGGMKLLRDDEWWIEGGDEFSTDEYVDVDGDYDEPEELQFETGFGGSGSDPADWGDGSYDAQLAGAENNVEMHLGDLGIEDPAEMAEEAYSLAHDGAMNAGASPEEAASIAADIAADYGYVSEGYTILPPMDDKYVERDGLEGPFRLRSGKVYYYDPKAGKNYDPDTDMYMSDEDWFAHDADPNQIKPKYKAPAPAAPKPRERGRMDEGPGMMKKFAKHMKRGMGNWDGNVGHNYPADSSEPFNIMDRVRNYSTEELKDYMEQHKGHKPSSWSDTFVKLAKRELRRRGERDFEKYMDEAGGKQLTYKTDFGEIAPKKLDGLIMQAIKMYSMDPEALDDIRAVVLDDYIDGDISQVGVQDIAEIMDASGFEPVDDDTYGMGGDMFPDDDGDDIFYDKELGKWVPRVHEGRSSFDRDEETHSHATDKAHFKRKEMRSELGHEDEWNRRRAAKARINPRTGHHIMPATYDDLDESDSDKVPLTKGTRAWMKKTEKELMPNAVKLVKNDGGSHHGVTTSDKAKIAQLKKDGYKVVSNETAPKHGSKSFAQAGVRANKERNKQLPKAKRHVAKGHSVQSALDKFPAVFKKDLSEPSTIQGKIARDEEEWEGIKKVAKGKKTTEGSSNFKKDLSEGAQNFSSWSVSKLEAWLKKNDSDEPGMGQVFANQLKSARKELSKKRKAVKEGSSNFKKGPKLKGGGYAKPNKPAQKKAASKAGRQQDKKAVNEVFYGADSAGYKIFGVNDLIYDRLQSWAEQRNGQTTYDPEAETATIIFDGGVNDEIDRNMDYFKSNWQVQTMTIQNDQDGDYGDHGQYDLGETETMFDRELNELETATDQLDQDRGLGEPTQTEPSMGVDSDAELAGMQQLIKNTMQEPDKDMEDAIQQMAMGDEDPNAALATDEVQQLRNLLGMFKQ